MSYEHIMAGAVTLCLVIAIYIAFFKKENTHEHKNS